MIHVLLVEDKNMSRETMGGYIKRSGRYELTASITNAGMAEMACMRFSFDLVLMDVCTDNNESGLTAAAVIKRHFPKIKVIVVTSMADSDFMRRAREAGAESFWFKGNTLLIGRRRCRATGIIGWRRSPKTETVRRRTIW